MAESNEITGILNKYGAEISATLKNDIQSKVLLGVAPANASGKLKDSVHYTIKDNVLRVWALQYIGAVENGRKPTQKSQGGVLRPAIEKWIVDKGLILNGISVKSLAFLIARKIHEEGTNAYRKGGTKLVEDILTPELKGQIQSQLILTFRAKTNALMRSAIVGK